MSGDLGGHSISGWSFPDASPIQSPGPFVSDIPTFPPPCFEIMYAEMSYGSLLAT
jgi:hypothetical protein